MRIKNWKRFQHFHDRKPTWIKLYRDLLDDREWHKLEPKASKMLVMLWLLASENDGELPDHETIAFRLRLSVQQVELDISKLSQWLEESDITMISSGYQDDSPEKRREREEKEITPQVADLLPGVDPDVLKDFVALRKKLRAPITKIAAKGLIREADKAGVTLNQALTICCERSWRGFNADWLKDGKARPDAFDWDEALKGAA